MQSDVNTLPFPFSFLMTKEQYDKLKAVGTGPVIFFCAFLLYKFPPDEWSHGITIVAAIVNFLYGLCVDNAREHLLVVSTLIIFFGNIGVVVLVVNTEVWIKAQHLFYPYCLLLIYAIIEGAKAFSVNDDRHGTLIREKEAKRAALRWHISITRARKISM